jgi:hypothetical protein
MYIKKISIGEKQAQEEIYLFPSNLRAMSKTVKKRANEGKVIINLI